MSPKIDSEPQTPHELRDPQTLNPKPGTLSPKPCKPHFMLHESLGVSMGRFFGEVLGSSQLLKRGVPGCPARALRFMGSYNLQLSEVSSFEHTYFRSRSHTHAPSCSPNGLNNRTDHFGRAEPLTGWRGRDGPAKATPPLESAARSVR